MTPQQNVTILALFLRFLTIGAISFGGGIIAYLQRMLVDQTHWFTKDQFLAALELAQTLPGTNSANLSVVVGDVYGRVPGAIAAFLGLSLPGAILAFILAFGSARGGHHPIGHAALAGVTAAAVGILAAITLRTGKDQFVRIPDVIILILTFVGMAILKLPMLLLLIVLGGISVFYYRPRQNDRA